MLSFASDYIIVFILFSIMGAIIGFAIHKILICTVIGMVVGLIAEYICGESELYSIEKRCEKEKLEKEIKYVESRKLNKSLSKNINYYLKTGSVCDDYYQYRDFTCCSHMLNKQICKMINCFRNWLLQNVDNPKYYKDYHTCKGVIREVRLGGIFVYSLYEKYKSEVIEKNDIDAIQIIEYWEDSELAHWREIIKNYGFDYKVHMEDKTPNNYFQNVIIYAYIQIS